MDAVRRLREKFLGAGGTQSDFEALGRGHLQLGDTERQDGSTRPEEARAVAHKCMGHGSLVEMHCYDGRGRNQGDGQGSEESTWWPRMSTMSGGPLMRLTSAK